MTKIAKLTFAKLAAPKAGVAVAFVDEDLAGGPVLSAMLEGAGDILARAAGIAEFKGGKGTSLDLIAPAGLSIDRLIVVGLGKTADLGEQDWVNLGGTVYGALKAAGGKDVSVILEMPDGHGPDAETAAHFAMGMTLRGYTFDAYKSKKDDDKTAKGLKISVLTAEPKAAKSAWEAGAAVADGVLLARDLVNEPSNILGPVEFAEKARDLEALGVEVEILGEKELKRLKMDALVGVAQGSVRPPRLAVMRWNGGKKNAKPLAFVGKGVTFDTGGISIKPAAGMEEMKGDMGGAATVVGLMNALAGRRAKINAVGVIGLVENMPDGNAQRPGDIVTAMSGTTIEILNTDAEGRLVLADALWYTQETYKPSVVIDLATLTGAVIVALGNHHAGLYANNDDLAAQLTAAGAATGEAVWRMPLSKDYDKLIDTPNADVKNTGGRWAGSITAAQFLQRFVKEETVWAHLDIAGTAFGAPKTEICQGWASGYGVRLLDRYVKDNHEA
ncbi:putative cytosol aminopeptidase [Roseibium aquae]|uniref:Probable cytosol aminopeptidase n=1 Tax=Roseibium aquae TaxID=1323746 RepID=A0A916WZN3_9HYPH|nr:leucyl aminopeptidase [Roseibium aquae]GGB43127.1 putative cytosol aminopeptidase [Roseibium aquae]